MKAKKAIYLLIYNNQGQAKSAIGGGGEFVGFVLNNYICLLSFFFPSFLKPRPNGFLLGLVALTPSKLFFFFFPFGLVEFLSHGSTLTIIIIT